MSYILILKTTGSQRKFQLYNQLIIKYLYLGSVVVGSHAIMKGLIFQLIKILVRLTTCDYHELPLFNTLKRFHIILLYITN